MTSHYTGVSVTTLHEFWRYLETVTFGYFLLGSHNLTVTALSSCVNQVVALTMLRGYLTMSPQPLFSIYLDDMMGQLFALFV